MFIYNQPIMITQLFFMFNHYLEKIPILTHIFQMGWFNHQLDKFIEL